jgi:hypothetical protein
VEYDSNERDVGQATCAAGTSNSQSLIESFQETRRQDYVRDYGTRSLPTGSGI